MSLSLFPVADLGLGGTSGTLGSGGNLCPPGSGTGRHLNLPLPLTASHRCDVCGKLLSTKLTLKRHKEQQHLQPLNNAVCNLCQKVFRTLNSLNNHKSIYHRRQKHQGGSGGGGGGGGSGNGGTPGSGNNNPQVTGATVNMGPSSVNILNSDNPNHTVHSTSGPLGVVTQSTTSHHRHTHQQSHTVTKPCIEYL